MDEIIQIKNLKTHFKTDFGLVKAVDDISFHAKKGEVLAIVGESGCGKSVTAKTIMGLIKKPPGIIEGEIIFEGQVLNKLSPLEFDNIRGKKIGMIFQEPMSSFDALERIGDQIDESLATHSDLNRVERKETIINMMNKVGIPEAEKRFYEYPHQMSGGMLQRLMITLVLVNKPSLIIADEPTTALDVTIQAQVLNIMKGLQKETGATIIIITHDLGVVAEIADRVHVMYAGKMIEKQSVKGLFSNPKHPYTQGLMRSKIEKSLKGKSLINIKGTVPPAFDFPKGCRFHPRCLKAMDICKEKSPDEIVNTDGAAVSCWLYKENK